MNEAERESYRLAVEKMMKEKEEKEGPKKEEKQK